MTAETSHPEALHWGFHGSIEFTIEGGVAGRSAVTVTAGTVDDDAIALFGRHQCHRLAAALACAAGWPVLTVQRQTRTGQWEAVHSAAAPGPDRALDIEGEISREALLDRWQQRNPDSRLRLREFAVEDMPGGVVADVDHLAGDGWWWTAGAPVELVAATSHFAHLLLDGQQGATDGA